MDWTPAAATAFKEIKLALINTTLLVHPKPDAPISVMSDASDTAIGAVLQQLVNERWAPISFFSRKLSATEQKYSTFDRELLAVYSAIKHFRHFLEGRDFHVLTDHKPLTHSLSAKPDRHSPRQVRQLDFISQFTTDIRHITGRDNPVADALSRSAANAVHLESTPPIVDFRELAKAQENDPELLQLRSTCPSLTFAQVPLPNCDGTVWCDTSTGTPRPFVPQRFRRKVFDSLHAIAHPGVKGTQRLITTRFVWHGINRDVRQWARTCIQCQRAKVHRHTAAPLATFATPDIRFDQLHIDLVGPLPISQNCTYLLTCIDRYTRWPEAFPLTDATAESIARALVSGWIARFGVPSSITTDRGQQFESELWRQLMYLLGTRRIRTTAYHPIANGLIERFHRQLKSAFKCLPNSVHWVDALPLILLSFRTTVKEDLKCTTAELVYGTTLRLPGEFFTTSSTNSDPMSYAAQLKLAMERLRPTPVRRQLPRKSFVSDNLSNCTHVFIRHDAVKRPLQQP